MNKRFRFNFVGIVAFVAVVIAIMTWQRRLPTARRWSNKETPCQPDARRPSPVSSVDRLLLTCNVTGEMTFVSFRTLLVK